MHPAAKLLAPLSFCLLIAAGARAQQGGFTPEDAVKRMVVPDGLEVKLVACEPEIRQPISVSFDERGRMWVVQYLQYPHPAGLKPVTVDEYLRTTYDKVPEPPPKGVKGDDRITICEDIDANGRAHKFKDFVTGLNLATGMVTGYGGVYVVQPPYLLFYPDRNRDDVPDGDPEVLLSGFGIQDTHALANSLQFGPDGWLYGAQGSTVISHVNGIEFSQGIWRFHPVTKKFELFAEGGGNTWGLDFDEHGNVIAGTNYGEKTALHQVQGAYYVKNFSKHGALHNPYAFGYFDHIPNKDYRGGHVTIGGIVYQGHALPERFDGTYIAGNLLANSVYWHIFHRDGSSFTMQVGGDFLLSNDSWFRPVDCLTGPDGSVYIADWYDKRATHVDPHDNWDKTNGRIYKVQSKNAKPLAPFDLSKKSSAELVGLFTHPNEWFVQTARQLLAERQDASMYPALRKLISDNQGKLALEALWALYASGGLDDAFALETLSHSNEDVRWWTIRLLGDACHVSPAVAKRFEEIARKDPSPVVRNQLACTAKRLPGKDALPIIRSMLSRDEDISDPQIPLLLWWAVESKALSDRDGVLSLLSSQSDWQPAITRQYIVGRLARRYAADESDINFATCARLLSMAPGPAEVDLLIGGMEKAFEGRALEKVPAPLEPALRKLWSQGDPSPLLIRFAARLGSEEAVTRAQALIGDGKVPENERITTITLLGQIARAQSQAPLLKLLGGKESGKVKAAALDALQSYSDPAIAHRVIELYPKMKSDLRTHARALLVGRSSWALALLQAVDGHQMDPKDIPMLQVRKMATYSDKAVAALVAKYWGQVQGKTTDAKLALLKGFGSIIKESKEKQSRGNPAEGHKIFVTMCSICHSLFGEGNHFGPDLTTVDRKNTNFMMENIVLPSLSIRPEFVASTVELKDGRTLMGLVTESNDQTITLTIAPNQPTVLARSQIKNMAPSPISMMPEGLLEALQPQQIRDLFSYLQSDGPK